MNDTERMHAVRFWIGWWVVCFVGWLLATFNPVWQELVAGAVASAIAATAAEVVRRQNLIRYSPSARWLARSWRVVPEMVRDTGTLAGVLYRRIVRREEVTGAWRAVPFEWGGDDPRRTAKRAIVVIAISATPNTYAVGIDRERDLLLVHQLVPGPRERAAQEVTGWL
ncbi:MAG: Na+/H+ antiporter subunit E [Actinomycetota bacterium]